MADTLQLTVTGMTCGGCENAVMPTLKQLRGVQDARVSHTASLVAVTFDETAATPSVIRSAIEGLGYAVAP